jgi:hypothetical protein
VLTKSFYGSENPKLTGELLAEAPAIFNWALEGLDRLNQRGYFVNPESGNDAIQQMEDLSSPIGTTVPNRLDRLDQHNPTDASLVLVVQVVQAIRQCIPHGRMAMTTTELEVETVVLKGGLIVSLPALRVLWDLEAEAWTSSSPPTVASWSGRMPASTTMTVP